MELNEVRTLLINVKFPGDNDQSYLLAIADPSIRKEIIKKREESVNEDQTRLAAVIEIQRIWRGHRTRSKLKDILCLHKPQSSCTSTKSQDSLTLQGIIKRKVWTRHTAAVAIQQTWRGYSDYKVFKYYKELINFHRKGNPASLLKCINPLEAQLLDKASGGYVRFRLGGDKFPPTIYYKIFTTRTIVDMCTFSPRDYTAMSERRQLGQDIHNTNPRILPVNTDNWYRRQENNGWRPISSSRMFSSDQYMTSCLTKSVPFHHMNCQRQEDIVKRRKQRKREWMIKLYRENSREHFKQRTEGTLQTTPVDSEQQDQRELMEEDKIEDIEESIDDLIQWSTTLDFEQYISDWQTLGTSSVHDDPYTIKLTTKIES